MIVERLALLAELISRCKEMVAVLEREPQNHRCPTWPECPFRHEVRRVRAQLRRLGEWA